LTLAASRRGRNRSLFLSAFSKHGESEAIKWVVFANDASRRTEFSSGEYRNLNRSHESSSCYCGSAGRLTPGRCCGSLTAHSGLRFWCAVASATPRDLDLACRSLSVVRRKSAVSFQGNSQKL